MKELENYLKEQGIFPKIDFSDKNVHEFKILKGKEDVYEDGTKYFKMLVEENGEMMVVSTPSVLIDIRKCEVGDVYSAQMKLKMIAGTPIQTYTVNKLKSGAKVKEATKEEKEILDSAIKSYKWLKIMMIFYSKKLAG